LQIESITRRFAATLGALVALAAAALLGAEPWRDAPDYLRLFAPASHRSDYRTSVSPLPLDDVLRGLAGDGSLAKAAGAWTPRFEYALDAFGRSGPYDRWKVARLYGPRQARVARGARMEGGRLVESWTLISPYPSADLERLEPGTLRIVLRIAQ
jgi:hypothetical protein